MRIIARKSDLLGTITIPSSKSHTVRSVYIASLADGRSKIQNPLSSSDALSAVSACEALGAQIDTSDKEEWNIDGFASIPKVPSNIIDIGNSGTSLRLGAAIASLSGEKISFTGDEQIQKRPMQPLLDALSNLGVKTSTQNNNGSAPLSVQGPLQGGVTEVDGITSQFLSALLIACPLAKKDSVLTPINLQEKPYIGITLDWLDYQKIKYQQLGEKKEYQKFMIQGNQSYKSFTRKVPGDFSSATFPACAAAMTGSKVTLKGLNMQDSQGDKKIFDYLKQFGAEIKAKEDSITVLGNELCGTEIDMNETPDALPAFAALATQASGKTKLYNVSNARIKETDRILAMATELRKLGAKVEEFHDGLIIHNSELKGTHVHGYNDHRIVMALALAGLVASKDTIIDTADAINITYPTFIESMVKLGADIEPII